MTTSKFRCLMLAGCASVALSTPALAQEATTDSSATTAASRPTAGQDDAGEVTVTGSRLITNGNN